MPPRHLCITGPHSHARANRVARCWHRSQANGFRYAACRTGSAPNADSGRSVAVTNALLQVLAAEDSVEVAAGLCQEVAQSRELVGIGAAREHLACDHQVAHLLADLTQYRVRALHIERVAERLTVLRYVGAPSVGEVRHLAAAVGGDGDE